MGRGAPRVPPGVEPAAVGLDELLRCLMGRVAGPVRQIQEEGLLRGDVAEVVHELDGAISEVLGEVIAVVGGVRRFDEMVVVHEIGCVLVGLGAHEAVVALEPPTQRPPSP